MLEPLVNLAKMEHLEIPVHLAKAVDKELQARLDHRDLPAIQDNPERPASMPSLPHSQFSPLPNKIDACASWPIRSSRPPWFSR
jgi:hypothetical protein